MLTRTQYETYRIFTEHFGYNIEWLLEASPEEIQSEAYRFASDYNKWLGWCNVSRDEIARGFVSYIEEIHRILGVQARMACRDYVKGGV